MKLLLSAIFSIFSSSVAIAQAQIQSPNIETMGTMALPATVSVSVQVNNWKQQTQQQPNDAGAWLNYYNWLNRSRESEFPRKKDELKDVVSKSGRYIAKSWQYSLMVFIQSGKRDSVSLFQAMGRAEDKTILYPYAIQYAAIRHDEKLLRNYCTLLNNTLPLSRNLYEYHFNSLMSAEKNATIYARGLHDLVPMLTLQQVHHVRRDIHLEYYADEIPNTQNAYLCLSLGAGILEQYPGASYTGLLVRLDNATTFPELEKHVLQDFSLLQLEGITSLTENEQLIYRNYLPAFILLYKNYKTASDQRAVHWKKLLLKLAQITGAEESVNKIIAP